MAATVPTAESQQRHIPTAEHSSSMQSNTCDSDDSEGSSLLVFSGISHLKVHRSTVQAPFLHPASSKTEQRAASHGRRASSQIIDRKHAVLDPYFLSDCRASLSADGGILLRPGSPTQLSPQGAGTSAQWTEVCWGFAQMHVRAIIGPRFAASSASRSEPSAPQKQLTLPPAQHGHKPGRA